ncbi:MAG: class I SAM-dependent methyltransferase [Candidatus Micrarchaeota archaeon]
MPTGREASPEGSPQGRRGRKPPREELARFHGKAGIERELRESLGQIIGVSLMTGEQSSAQPVDERQIRLWHLKMQRGRSRKTLIDMESWISRVLKEIAMSPGSYLANCIRILMRHWTRQAEEGVGSAYDRHMDEHVQTISGLMDAWVAQKHFIMLHFGRLQAKGKLQIFDASCGTGTVLKQFLEKLPPNLLERAHIVANDLSESSIEEAKKTLAPLMERGVDITFSKIDIAVEALPGRFDIMLLSQTIPFICDENALRDERNDLALPSEARHETAKSALLSKLFGHLTKYGSLLIIDEDPMKLSTQAYDFDSLLEKMLFDEVCRFLDKKTLINRIMKRNSDARFESHLESPIDREHSMYMMEYSLARHREALADGMSEDEHVNDIFMKMMRIHPALIGRLGGFDKSMCTAYRELGTECKVLMINPTAYEENIKGKPYYWAKNGSYDLVVISRLMHELGGDGFESLMDRLKRSRKMEPGAALLVIDQWPAPMKTEENSEGFDPGMIVGNRDARELILPRDDHEFVASVRSGNFYGYLYVIRNLF